MINIQGLELFENSGAHDYEIEWININYVEAEIILKLKNSKNKSYDFYIKEFKYFNITHKEKWGKGKYICDSDLKQSDSDDLYVLEITLNSGDEITIQFTMN